MQQRIDLLITDLDDTVWDWLEMWHNSFQPYLQAIANRTGINVEQLKKDFKVLHQKYGTSECSYAYKELKSIKVKHVKLIEDESSGPSIIHKYYRNKKDSLRLYEGVYESLLQLKKIGVKILGFTESNIYYTKYRIKSLGLDGLFDSVYTTEDHKIPATVERYYSENYWNTVFTKIKILPSGTKKPDPNVLLSIIKEVGGKVENTVYVGDKLHRDIYMANLAKVTCVHAEYGHVIDNDSYKLLKEVTHWSDKDVKKEIDFRNNIMESKITPQFTINSFNKLLTLFQFKKFDEKKDSEEDKKNKIEIWKNIISVQMHFNSIEIKIRQFALTLFTFIIAAIGYTMKDQSVTILFGFIIPLGSIIGLFV